MLLWHTSRRNMRDLQTNHRNMGLWHTNRRSPRRSTRTSQIAVAAGAWLALCVVSGRSAGAQTTVTLPLDVTAEVRVRSEFDKAPGASSDLFTYLRSRLGVRVTAAPGVRILLQVQDSRVLGSEGVAAASAADVFELHQGYLDLGHHISQRQFDLRAGRQEILVGNERLVGVSNWTNLGRSFDGFRLTLSSDTITKNVKWTLNAFAATVEERGRHFGAATLANAGANTAPVASTDHTVAGVFASHGFPRSTTLETTVLFDESGKFRRYKDSNRGTVYGRARAPLILGLRADAEAAYQFGNQKYTATDTSAVAISQDVRAWLLALRLATPAVTPHKLIGTLGADALSGDATPADGTYGAFSTLYASNHSFYGLQDVIGDPAATTRERGLVDVFALASINVTRQALVRAEAHQFTLQTGSNRALGSELDLTLPVRLGSAANLDVGYSVFRGGAGASAVGLGALHATRQWAYLQLRVGI